MTDYRLHYFPESGNSYKLALMLTLCGQTFEPVWTDFAGGATRSAQWRESVNAMGEIPVLEDSGVRLTQTAPILLRLAARYGKFGGDSDAERFEILRWLFWDNHKLTSYMATFRFNRAFTPAPDAQVLAFFRKRLDDFLGILERHVRDRAFVAGDKPYHRGSIDGRLLVLSQGGNRLRSRREPSSRVGVARPVAALPGWRAPYDLLPGQRFKRYT